MRELTIEEAERHIEITLARAPRSLIDAFIEGVRRGVYLFAVDAEGKVHTGICPGLSIRDVRNILLQEPTGDN